MALFLFVPSRRYIDRLKPLVNYKLSLHLQCCTGLSEDNLHSLFSCVFGAMMPTSYAWHVWQADGDTMSACVCVCVCERNYSQVDRARNVDSIGIWLLIYINCGLFSRATTSNCYQLMPPPHVADAIIQSVTLKIFDGSYGCAYMTTN